MNYTSKELELCRWLHDHGVRPEIQFADCFIRLWEEGDEIYVCPDWDCALDLNADRDKYVLLFTWERARGWLKKGWLRQTGWAICFHADLFNRKYENVFVKIFQRDKSSEDSKYLDGIGQTDLEAILSVMRRVEEEKL